LSCRLPPAAKSDLQVQCPAQAIFATLFCASSGRAGLGLLRDACARTLLSAALVCRAIFGDLSCRACKLCNFDELGICSASATHEQRDGQALTVYLRRISKIEARSIGGPALAPMLPAQDLPPREGARGCDGADRQ